MYTREDDIKTWLVGEQSHEQIKKMAEKVLLEQLANESPDQFCLHPAFVVSKGTMSQWDMFADQAQAKKYRPYVGSLMRCFLAKLIETVGGPRQVDAVGYIVKIGERSDSSEHISALILEMKKQPSYLLIPMKAFTGEPNDDGCPVVYKVMREEDRKYFSLGLINDKLLQPDLSGPHITIKFKEEAN